MWDVCCVGLAELAEKKNAVGNNHATLVVGDPSKICNDIFIVISIFRLFFCERFLLELSCLSAQDVKACRLQACVRGCGMKHAFVSIASSYVGLCVAAVLRQHGYDIVGSCRTEGESFVPVKSIKIQVQYDIQILTS